MDGDPAEGGASCADRSARARHGTTTIFPTTTTGSTEEIRRTLRACAETQASWSVANGARIGGAHYYGPYFCRGKRWAATPWGRTARSRSSLNHEALSGDGDRSDRPARPRLPGSRSSFTGDAREPRLPGYLRPTRIPLRTEMARACEAGMRHVDHFWCAMSPRSLDTRPVAARRVRGSMEQFHCWRTRERSTEIIADGCHLAP